MNWKRPILLLAALCGCLSTHAASAPAIPDQELMHYLTPQQVTQWNAATKAQTAAQADLLKGQKMTTQTADPSAIVKEDLTQVHTKGAAMVTAANKILSDQRKIIASLRNTAKENRNKTLGQAEITGELTYTVPTAQWPEAVTAMTKSVFSSLTDLKYKHIYLAGVYAFDKDKYTTKPDLTAQVLQQLTALDKDKIFSPKGAGEFKLGQDSNKLFVAYPDRVANQAANAKSAAIVGEVLFESRSGYATVSLRAIDLATMRILANQTMMLSVEPSLGKMLGLSAATVPSKRIQPVVVDKNSKDKEDEPAAPVAVNLKDPSDFLSKAKQAKTSFGVTTAGRADSLANRFAILLLKSYFTEEHKDLKTSDVDFLTMALPDEKPDVTATIPADVSGAWVLPSVDDLSASISLDPLKAHDLTSNADVTVGKLSVERSLPKLNYPTSEELQAGGYGTK